MSEIRRRPDGVGARCPIALAKGCRSPGTRPSRRLFVRRRGRFRPRPRGLEGRL